MTSVFNGSHKRQTATYLVVVVLFIVALFVTFGRTSIVSAAQIDLTSVYVDEELPVDDASSLLWDAATEVEIPLSGQNIVPPFNVDVTVDTIRIRSIHNGTWIAFRLEWNDMTMNEGGGSDDYRDSVALQFPVEGGEPFVCMGFIDSEVNILHWRADFQRVIVDGPLSINDIFPNAKVNIYNQADDPVFITARSIGNPIAAGEKPSAVEDLIATGFGTLETQEQVNTTGWGDWDGSKWNVVIARQLQTSDPQDAQFKIGSETPLALAVWDGEERDVNGKKSVSAWVNIGVETLPGVSGATIGTPPRADDSPAPGVEIETSNGMLWVVIGVLVVIAGVFVVIVGLLIWDPVAIFSTKRQEQGGTARKRKI